VREVPRHPGSHAASGAEHGALTTRASYRCPGIVRPEAGPSAKVPDGPGGRGGCLLAAFGGTQAVGKAGDQGRDEGVTGSGGIDDGAVGQRDDQ
jgi:hypothetical protein